MPNRMATATMIGGPWHTQLRALPRYVLQAGHFVPMDLAAREFPERGEYVRKFDDRNEWTWVPAASAQRRD